MPDTIIPGPDDNAYATQITVTKASGFVVVSWWQESSRNPRKGSFLYTHHETLNGALDDYRQYRDGDWSDAAAMGIFSVNEAGLPLRRLDPEHLMRLMAETRAA